MKTALSLAGLVLAMGGLVGCGGDDGGDGGDSAADAPADASTDKFCKTFNGLFDKVMSQDVAGDSAAMVRALKDWAADIEEVGTPADMPDDARHGFELFVEQARDIDEDATLDDLEKIGEDLSESDQADGEAFSDWAQDSCPLDLPEVPPAS